MAAPRVSLFSLFPPVQILFLFRRASSRFAPPMPNPTDALDFLAAKRPSQPPGVCVVFGDEPFLKRLVLAELRRRVLGDDTEGEFSFSIFAGKTADLRRVLDELDTVALFGSSRRMVLIEEADSFVSEHRGALEDYVARGRFTGTLVLEVATWPKTTRLYKALAESGLQIDCKAPTAARLGKWLGTWASERHAATLQPAAADLLLEIVGPELGLLDSELAKLAAYAGHEPITPPMVHDLVGAWRTKTTWEMLDAATSGDAPGALRQLDRLLGSGEHPVAILGPIGYTLRRFAAATRLIENAPATSRPTLRDALLDAGIKPFAVQKAEGQLRQLGRQRAGQLYRWLLDTDLDLKGRSQLPPRTVLERLIVRMGKATGTRP
jgi:DNA polymerase-3 subunit delta